MPKSELEFLDTDTNYQWQPVEGDTLGIMENL